jgi:Mlc titration factor MtfA (ptsG expression regulator)
LSRTASTRHVPRAKVAAVLDFLFKNKRRAGLRARHFPAEWTAILERNVSFFRHLTADDRREIEGHVQVFIAEKSFEGCGGLELTDEIRVTIAAQACLLLLHRETDDYPTLDSILVYPHAYVARSTQRLEGGVVVEGAAARLGESWTRGVVVLAWDHVLSGAVSMHDGHNVVFHEFAHQLDAEDGAMDGAPMVGARTRYTAWARTLGEEYEALCARVSRHRPTDLDAYGATNPAEFFAVVTEAFFEKPRALQAKHAALYAELAEFYRQDPATWDEA